MATVYVDRTGLTSQDSIRRAEAYMNDLNKYLKQDKRDLLVREQNEIMKLYSEAFTDMVEKELARAGNDKKKIDKLTAAYSQQLYSQLRTLCRDYNKRIASYVTNAQAQIVGAIIDNDWRDFNNAVNDVADICNRNLIEQMIKGKIYKDNKGLDDRLWETTNASGQKLNTAIMSCIAQGQGAAEMSKTIKEFAKGGHRTWDRKKIRDKLGDGYARSYGSGGLDYESLRLARTTITHQAQIATLETQKINPYMNGVKWHSDHQAGRTCQECIDRNGTVYNINKDSVPLDHPNGGCWLEPIYMINGKEATVEEIAQDMKNWAEGKPNSGLMNTIPEYKDLEGTHKPKVANWKDYLVNEDEEDDGKIKLTDAELLEKPPAGYIYTDKQRQFRYQQFEEELDKLLPDDREEKYSAAAILEQLKQAPKQVQDMYLSLGKFQLESQNKNGAFYSPGDKKIHYGLKDIYNNHIRFGEEHRFDVLFHEWGHLIDDQWKDSVGTTVFKRVRIANNLTHKGALAEALGKDAENWQKAWVQEKWQGKKTWEDAKDMPLVRNKFSEFLNQNEKHTIAIQDGVRGITDGKIRTQWGHDTKYYKWYAQYGDITDEDSANIRVSSELWAEISAGMTQPETKEFLETNFPETVKEYNKLLKQAIRQHRVEHPQPFKDLVEEF